jgi:hypothetical protein
MTEIETENVETIETETAEIDVIDTGTATVVVVDDTPPAETGATMAQLVETIATLNDSITALRLQVENERNQNLDAMLSKIDELGAQIAALQIEEKHEHSPAETVAEIGRKPASRWLTGKR